MKNCFGIIWKKKVSSLKFFKTYSTTRNKNIGSSKRIEFRAEKISSRHYFERRPEFEMEVEKDFLIFQFKFI